MLWGGVLMRRDKIIYGLLFATLFATGLTLVFHRPASGQLRAEIATVVEAVGTVERRAFLQPEWQGIATGESIHDRDELRTGAGARVLVRFTDQTTVTVTEKARVELKPSSLKIDSGSIESEGSGDNPFEISAGGLKVNFDSRSGKNFNLQNQHPFERLVDIKLSEIQAKKLDAAEMAELKRERTELQARFEEVRSTGTAGREEWQILWASLDDLAGRIKKARVNKVKIGRGESGQARAQVEEGELTLNIEGQAGPMQLSGGQAVLLDGEGGGVKQIELLAAPAALDPLPDSTVYNVTDVVCRWSPTTGAGSYRVSLASDPEYKVVMLERTVFEPTTTFPRLEVGRVYHWQVQGVDADDFEGHPLKASFRLEEDRTPPEFDIEDIKF